MNKILKIGLLELANLAIFILGGTSGLIHPICYAYVGAAASAVCTRISASVALF